MNNKGFDGFISKETKRTTIMITTESVFDTINNNILKISNDNIIENTIIENCINIKNKNSSINSNSNDNGGYIIDSTVS